MKPSKCALFKDQVCYLGHIASPSSITTDPSKTSKITEWQTPTNIQQLQQFLDLAGDTTGVLFRILQIARPLYQLTEKGRQFHWIHNCQSAFSELKSWLTSSPILAFPDFQLAFILGWDREGDCLCQQVIHQSWLCYSQA